MHDAQMIPDEAVEAAAAAIFANAEAIQTPEYAEEIARLALEAAAPHMAAQALGNAAEAIDADPYDDLDPFYAGWLRDRARKIREEA